MRREKHRMPLDECIEMLKRAEVVRLGFSDAEGPYVVPVNFGYEDATAANPLGRLYAHGALSGRRIDAAAAGTRVCFEVDEGEVLLGELPCDTTARFRSVIGYGTMRLLETDEEKLQGLEVLMRQYGSTGDGIPARELALTSVTVIDIDSMDGKRHR